MTLIYLGGPMSGLPEFNYPAFHAAAADLRARGFDVVNPAELHNAGEPPAAGEERPWSWYMRQALMALLGCDQLVLLPDWQSSRGAVLEEHVANALGMPVGQYGSCSTCGEPVSVVPREGGGADWVCDGDDGCGQVA